MSIGWVKRHVRDSAMQELDGRSQSKMNREPPTSKYVSHASCSPRSQVEHTLDTGDLLHAENLNTEPTARRKKSEAGLAGSS